MILESFVLTIFATYFAHNIYMIISRVKQTRFKRTLTPFPLSQWRAYSFCSLFILAVATLSLKDHKLFSTTYILCSKEISN